MHRSQGKEGWFPARVLLQVCLGIQEYEVMEHLLVEFLKKHALLFPLPIIQMVAKSCVQPAYKSLKRSFQVHEPAKIS